MNQIRGSDEELLRAEIPIEWLESRSIGRLRVHTSQSWLDLRDLETRQMVRTELASVLVQLGLPDLDVGTARGPSRRLTQEIARWAYAHEYSGIIHTSRLADTLDCWAIFDRAQFVQLGIAEDVRADNPDLIAAARDLSLILPGD
jgi:hypothetical protein